MSRQGALKAFLQACGDLPKALEDVEGLLGEGLDAVTSPALEPSLQELGATSAAVGALLAVGVEPSVPRRPAQSPLAAARRPPNARFRLLFSTLRRLVPYFASPQCDPRVLHRHLVSVAAGVLTLAHCPPITATFLPPPTHTRFESFDTPASVYLKTTPSPTVAASVPTDVAVDRPRSDELAAITSTFDALVAGLPVDTRLRVFMSLSPPGAPLWFQTAVGRRLSQTIMCEGAVEALLHTTVVPAEDGEQGAAAAAAVASLLTTVPRDMTSADTYFRAVGPQVLGVLGLGGSTGRLLAHAAAITLATMLAADTTAIRACVLRPLVGPLLTYTRPPQGVGDDLVVVAEGDLVACVERLHRVVTAATPAPATMDALAHVMPALFDLYCFVVQSKSHVTSACEELMAAYLKFASEPLPVVLELCVPGSAAGRLRAADPRWSPTRGRALRFVAGPTAGVQLVGGAGVGAADEPPLAGLGKPGSQPPTAAAVVRLLQLPALRKTSLPGDVLVALLQQYMAWRAAGSAFAEDGPGIREAGSAPAVPAPSAASIVRLLHVLVCLCESLGAAVLTNTAQALGAVRAVLDTLVGGGGDGTEDGFEVLSLCLSLLSLPVDGGVPVSAEEEPMLRGFLPSLAVLSKHPRPEVSELATVLRMSILTRGGALPPGDGAADGGEARVAAVLATAMSYLRDTEVPIQAGGLQTITGLVKERHPALGPRLKDVMDLMVAQLHNTDTYVFLAAVAGVAALADGYPETAIPALARALGDTTLPYSVRCKVGMSASAAIRRCGATFPAFAGRVVAACVRGVRPVASPVLAGGDTEDDVSEFRAGCLSCLGDVCNVVGGAAMVKHVGDIVDCCKGVLQFEAGRASSAIVRRAAGFVLVQLTGLLAKAGALEAVGHHLAAVKPVVELTAASDRDARSRTHARDVLLLLEDAVGDVLDVGDRPRVLRVGLAGSAVR